MAHPQPTTALPTGPESPALGVTVSGNVQKYSMKKKKILNTEESELFELTQAAGIALDQEVFKVIVDLLKMNVAPLAVFQTLKAMCAGQRVADAAALDGSTAPHAASAPAEPRVRSKVGQGGRDGSSQRVPRQPSASRAQKAGKSSGSSSSSSQLTSS